MGFHIGGLIFDSEEEFNLFKNIDSNINQTVREIEDERITMEEFFNKIKKINVTETYYDANEELDKLFLNATKLLCYRGTRFITDYKVASCFFDKINVIKFNESDSDSDSDSESDIDFDSDSESGSELEVEVEVEVKVK